MATNDNKYWGFCRINSECVYAICKLLHLKGDFKINIIQFLRGDSIRQRGHAWVTRDDKDLFLTPAFRPKTIEKLGGNEKYCYWVAVKQGRLKEVHD